MNYARFVSQAYSPLNKEIYGYVFKKRYAWGKLWTKDKTAVLGITAANFMYEEAMTFLEWLRVIRINKDKLAKTIHIYQRRGYKVILVGHSIGGMFVIEFFQDDPDLKGVTGYAYNPAFTKPSLYVDKNIKHRQRSNPYMTRHLYIYRVRGDRLTTWSSKIKSKVNVSVPRTKWYVSPHHIPQLL